jgi:tripartite ATP-independent transporter DctP family solute receptor
MGRIYLPRRVRTTAFDRDAQWDADVKRRTLLCSAATAVACMVTAQAQSKPSGVLTATDVHPTDYPTVAAVQWIGAQLELRTGGRLRIRQYNSGQLGRESDAINMARFGAIDITRVYTGALNNAFPLTRAVCLPYVFESVAHLRRVLDGEVGRSILEGFAARDLVGLAIYDSGARCFYNTRGPVLVPSDLAGLKLRVPASDIFIEMLRLCGANPTPLDYGAVYSALETRLIDGAENNVRSFHSSRHFEAAHFWSKSEHSYAPDVLLISRRRFEALTVADQHLLRELAAASVSVLRKSWDAGEATARSAIATAGVQSNAVDTAAFRAAVAPLIEHYRGNAEIDRLYGLIRRLA